jgi:hypothetical protein
VDKADSAVQAASALILQTQDGNSGGYGHSSVDHCSCYGGASIGGGGIPAQAVAAEEDSALRRAVNKTEVLSPGTRLRVFALIPEGEVHVQFIFAAATFFDMGGPQSLKPKVIGFSGDRSKDQTLTRYTLQPENTRNWKKVRDSFEEATFLTHDPGAVRAEKVLPWTVLLPTANCK